MLIVGQFNPLAPTESVRLFTIDLGRMQVPFTNHMFMVSLATVILGLVVPIISRANRGIGLLRTGIEAICVYLREQMARPILGPYTDTYIGFVWTIFFLILTLNLLGMVPTEQIVTILTGRTSHWGGPATANIYVTGGLAAVCFFMTHLAGIRRHGLLGYLVVIAPQALGGSDPCCSS
ncbi:MAG: F0F1 ATP synthase subunit A [Sedimentisphaerales bacterium]|jgi:F-type H+-transporting ATPase subunit a|nr:F0F1 ATP synthase subunit A [Sedimentisphaerales bacterium]